jgi:hypothetical protein
MMVVLRLDIFGQAVSEWLPRTAYSQIVRMLVFINMMVSILHLLQPLLEML